MASCALGVIAPEHARADIDLEFTGLREPGGDGRCIQQLYALQLGGAAECDRLSLTVLGVRATRSFGTNLERPAARR